MSHGFGPHLSPTRGARALQPRGAGAAAAGGKCHCFWAASLPELVAKNLGTPISHLKLQRNPRWRRVTRPRLANGRPVRAHCLVGARCFARPVADLASPKPVTTKPEMILNLSVPLAPCVGTLRCRLAHGAPAPQIATDRQQRQLTKLTKTSHLELKLHQST